MASNGGHGYGGDEEPTPVEPLIGSRVSPESKIFANLGLEHSHAAECMWRLARQYDATDGDARLALLAEAIVELAILADATTKARAALVMKRGEEIAK